jgi:hypothetical protein
MTKKEQEVHDAKLCMSDHIKFCKYILKNLKGHDERLCEHSMFITWSIQEFMHQLMTGKKSD